MKKLIIALCVALVVFAVGYNAYQSEKQAHADKRNVYAVLPLTGPLSVWGKQAKETMDYYLKKNPDTPMHLVYVDSESNPMKAVTGLQSKILNDKNPIVISAISSVSAALLPFLSQHNGFNVSMYTKVSPAIAQYQNQHRISFSILTEMGKQAMDYANGHYQTMTVFYSEDELGRLGLQALKNTFKGKIIDTFSFSVADRDVRNTVLKSLNKKPDAVYVIAPPSIGYMNIIKELVTQGYTGMIMTNQGFQVDWIYQNLNSVDNIMFPCYDILLEDNTSNKRKQIVTQLQNEGLHLNSLTIEPYNAIAFTDYLLRHNIPFERSEILKLKTFEGIAGTLTLTDDGESDFELTLCKVKDGKIAKVEE